VGLIIQEAPKTPFVIVGFGGFLLLILLGITSLKAVMRRMDSKKWKIIHRLVYVFGIVGLRWSSPLSAQGEDNTC
jgi:sulfoxide reductase heme-binding subunit YedZ